MSSVPAWFVESLHTPSLSSQQTTQLYEHYVLLIQWNQRMNLTSLRPGAEMVPRHYGESLFFATHLPITSPVSIADIGSGPGFPGVPLAVLLPDCRVTLVESNQRKAVFLKEATRTLPNVSVIAKRAEELDTSFDWVISRAVDPQVVLSFVPDLAPVVGLMLGEKDILEMKSRSDIAWSEPIQLPWGDRRFCLYGRST